MSRDSVHGFTKAWRNERAWPAAHACVSLSFAPGEAFPFDWSHETITLQGLPLVIKVAEMMLSQSRTVFVQANWNRNVKHRGNRLLVPM